MSRPRASDRRVTRGYEQASVGTPAAPRRVAHTEGARRVSARALPAEGDGGLFSQTWWPICLSAEATAEKPTGADFLDGRVVVFRTRDGVAHVLSAYCPHLGADLCVGDVVDGRLRCAFHHWCFDAAGRCTETRVGDPPPRHARLFTFPTVERYGVVWAFNGEQATWALPDFPYPDETLTVRALRLPGTLPVDPWVLCCNTPDMQHIKALHGVSFEHDDPHGRIEWTDHSMMYEFTSVHRRGEKVWNRIGIFGTSLYYQVTTIDGRWFGFLAPFGLPRPGQSITYMVVAARTDMGTPEEVERFLDFVVDLEQSVVSEDVAIMQTIRFRPGTLTASDRTLARFFSYLRHFPRAHPSAAFIK